MLRASWTPLARRFTPAGGGILLGTLFGGDYGVCSLTCADYTITFAGSWLDIDEQVGTEFRILDHQLPGRLAK